MYNSISIISRICKLYKKSPCCVLGTRNSNKRTDNRHIHENINFHNSFPPMSIHRSLYSEIVTDTVLYTHDIIARF